MAERKRVHHVIKETGAFDVNKLIEAGVIRNELDYERAMIADRKLRLMAKEDAKLKIVRSKLRDLVQVYEKRHWKTDQEVERKKLEEGDYAEARAEQERVFFAERKQLIRDKLKQFDLTQQQLGELLGHRSKTHISELMNGLTPFSLRDLNVIRLLLKINIDKLVPSFLSADEYPRIMMVVKKLKNSKLKVSRADLVKVLSQ